MGRIVNYPEITTLSDGDYLIVDNAEGGTKKVSAQSVACTVDPTPTENSTNAVSSGGVWTSLNDISEEFDGLRTDAYDVYPKGIASGDIVQFETGADNVPLSDLTGYIYPTMSGSGMPSRTNIRTISGPDDINIYQRNKNLIEQITYQSDPETVYLGVQNSSNLTMFFKAGDYRITVNIVGGSTVEPYWSVGSTATHSEYMHLDNDTNVSIYVYDADGISASDIASFQVEVGTEATDYVEFEGDITNVVLPTDRGTIYSGRVALTAGKVYIDTVIYERNSSTMNNTEDKPGWAYTGLQTYDVAIGTFDDVIYWPNGDVRCTNVNVGSTYSVEVENEDYSLILPRDVYNMSQSQWISAGVDIQILVKLNTPIEIDIDPVEVRSLYGFNTYYCNSGKIGVIFGMDLAKHITSKTSEVEDEMDKKIEKAFATDTASGAVATFTDGADDIPMKSVKVAIEPVQDLHGYDHPWPGGGKGNLFQTTATSKTENGGTWTVNAEGSVTASGTPTDYSYIDIGRAIVDGISESVTVNVDVVSSANNVAINNIQLYDVNNTRLTYIYNGGFVTTHTIDLSQYSNPHTIVVGLKRNNNNVALSGTYHVQVVKGTTVGDWYPYSNICPISGWTGANVVRTGKNLFNNTGTTQTINDVTFTVNSDGTVSCSGTATETAVFRINLTSSDLPQNKTLILNGCPSGGSFTSKYGQALCDSLGATLGSTTDDGTGATYSAANLENLAQFQIVVRSGINANGLVFKPMLRLASESDATFEPYQPIQSVNISLGQTVYGGTLDVTNGTLTVDRAMVDLGTL